MTHESEHDHTKCLDCHDDEHQKSQCEDCRCCTICCRCAAGEG